MLAIQPLNPATVDGDLKVRYLGGVSYPVCDSCRRSLAVLKASYDDDAFLVCWNCRP